jgi:hypothetical protein
VRGRRREAAPVPADRSGAPATTLDQLKIQYSSSYHPQVPRDQRPSSQLREVQESALLGWGGVELPGYLTRLGVFATFIYFVLAYPVACYSYNPATQPVEAIICSVVGKVELHNHTDLNYMIPALALAAKQCLR